MHRWTKQCANCKSSRKKGRDPSKTNEHGLNDAKNTTKHIDCATNSPKRVSSMIDIPKVGWGRGNQKAMERMFTAKGSEASPLRKVELKGPRSYLSWQTKANSKLSGKKHHNTSPFHAIVSPTTVVFHDDMVHSAQYASSHGTCVVHCANFPFAGRLRCHCLQVVTLLYLVHQKRWL